MAEAKTLMLAESPLTAKRRFQFRPLSNWAFCAAVFTVVAIVMVMTIPRPLVWIGDAAAIAILAFINFRVLPGRPIKMRCPKCWEILRTNTPWVCGFCQRKNEKVSEFPIIHECEHCGAEQKSYKCHHCSELIFLTDDRMKANYAVCFNSTVEPPPEDDKVLREKEKEKLNHDIVMTDLAAKLESNKQRLELGKKKTPVEEIEESFKKRDALVMGAHEFAEKQRAIYAKRYKKNPEMLKRANEFLDDWLRGRT